MLKKYIKKNSQKQQKNGDKILEKKNIRRMKFEKKNKQDK
jgi:hypothetical protein